MPACVFFLWILYPSTPIRISTSLHTPLSAPPCSRLNPPIPAAIHTTTPSKPFLPQPLLPTSVSPLPSLIPQTLPNHPPPPPPPTPLNPKKNLLQTPTNKQTPPPNTHNTTPSTTTARSAPKTTERQLGFYISSNRTRDWMMRRRYT